MKTQLYFSATVALFLSLLACNNDLNTPEPLLNSSKTISFTYKNVLYSSECIVEKDTTFFLNPEVQSIAHKLSQIPTLALVVSPDNELTYFDNSQEATDYLEVNDLEWQSSPNTSIQTKTNVRGAEVKLYEDSDFRGWCLTHTIMDGWDGVFDLTHGYPGKNDKISSLKLTALPGVERGDYSAVIVCYQDTEYKGSNAIYFYRDRPGTSEIRNLKDYVLYPGSARNWGDQISSYKYGIRTSSDIIHQNW